MSIHAHFVPNDKVKCLNCGASPTVDVYDAETKKLCDHTTLCGPCCFGEADCKDTHKWASKWRPEA